MTVKLQVISIQVKFGEPIMQTAYHNYYVDLSRRQLSGYI